MKMTKTDYQITNIIANTEIDALLDLSLLLKSLNNCEYDPELYHALIFRMKNPKLSILVNSSGKIIFSGAKSLKDINHARNLFFTDLIRLGYKPKKHEIFIQNIVLLFKPVNEIKIDRIINQNFNLDIQYEPEVFPGVIIRFLQPKFTAIIFRTGKISIVGLKNESDIPTTIDIINKLLEI